MSEFIDTSLGYINLAHVMLIRLGVEKEAGESLIQFHDGRSVTAHIIGPFTWIPGGPVPPQARQPDPEPEPVGFIERD